MKSDRILGKPAGSTSRFVKKPEQNLRSDLPAWRRYLAALCCILAAFGIRYWLTPVLGEELPFMLFIAAALVAAWYGGAVAGTASLLLGLFLADHFFLAKAKAQLTDSTEVLYFVRYLFTASLGIALIETLHRNRRKLQHEIERRQTSEAELMLAQNLLKTHADELEQSVASRTAELAASVNYLEGLLYHIGHNLRAPLRAMEGYATILVEEYAPRLDAAAKDYSAHISDAATRMDALVHDLLEYGRLGYVQLPLSCVSLDKVLDRVLFRLGYELLTANAEINVRGPLPHVRANAEMLEQVLTNLVDNAIKFVPLGTRPQVTIHADSPGPICRIWIDDNGVGIPDAYHQRIFEVFETLPSPQQPHNGTGIGLAVVKQGMQRMEGQVGVESRAGCGSRFWIELPVATPPASSKDQVQSALSGERNGRRGHLRPLLSMRRAWAGVCSKAGTHETAAPLQPGQGIS